MMKYGQLRCHIGDTFDVEITNDFMDGYYSMKVVDQEEIDNITILKVLVSTISYSETYQVGWEGFICRYSINEIQRYINDGRWKIIRTHQENYTSILPEDLFIL